MIKGLHHVAIGVPDMDRALAFYLGVLGFEQLWRAQFDRDAPFADKTIGLEEVAADVAMLKAGAAHIELWSYAHPAPTPRPIAPNDHGLTHLALEVTDLQADYDRLTAAGMRFVGPPVHMENGGGAIYGQDPFGNTIELYQLS